MDLVLFGRQGSGKGTQAAIFAERYGLTPFVTGNELRKLAKGETELGKKIKSIIEAGHLVPNEVVMEIIEHFMNQLEPGAKVLFDGIPRQAEQARTFNDLMEKCGRNFTCLYLDISNETAYERIAMRAEQEGRADDSNLEVIKTRLETYENETVPVIESYRAAGKMINVDGEPAISEVTEMAILELDKIFLAG